MPFFSVIVPVYGTEPWVGECADSVLRQTFSNLELILVDDGSPDNCPAICDAYAAQDGRVKALHQPNRGVAAARNHGLEAASGEMVLFLDSDDYWCRDTMLEEIHRICQAEPAVDAVYFKDQHLLPDGQIIDRPFPSDWNFNAMTPLEQFRAMVETDTFLGAPYMKAIRREFLVSREIRFPEDIWAEDVLWDMEVAAALPVNRMLDEYCYRIRRRENSRSGEASREHLYEYLTLLDRAMDLRPADHGAEQTVKSYAAYHYTILCAKVCGLSGAERRKFISELLKRKDLLNYDLNRKVRLVKKASRIVGTRLTIRLLGLYLRRRPA